MPGKCHHVLSLQPLCSRVYMQSPKGCNVTSLPPALWEMPYCTRHTQLCRAAGGWFSSHRCASVSAEGANACIELKTCLMKAMNGHLGWMLGVRLSIPLSGCCLGFAALKARAVRGWLLSVFVHDRKDWRPQSRASLSPLWSK